MADSSAAGQIPGAIPPPPGQKSNFIDPPNQNESLIALHTVCLTLITIFVGMRVYVRAVELRAFGLDDAFCVIGWGFAVAFSAIMLKAMTLGLGRHMWDIPITQFVDFGEWLYIIAIESSPAYLAIKLAFFWSYKRVFGPTKALRWACYIGAAICTGLYVAQIFHDIFLCIPVQKAYNPKLPGHCLPSGTDGSVTGIFNVISDFYIFVLPLPFVWRLQMNLYKRIRLMCLFGIGAFVNICSIFRLVYTYQIAGNPDLSYSVVKLYIWATLEIDIGLLCVCALIIPSFWNRILLSTWSSLRNRSSSSRLRSTGQQKTATSDPERGLKFVQPPRPSHSGTTLRDASHEYNISRTGTYTSEKIPMAELPAAAKRREYEYF